MDFESEFQIQPFPLETEFRLKSVCNRLNELTKEELRECLAEALPTMAKLVHQVKQLKERLQQLEGKI
jgi:uncharacterized coiled-coil protein SlyX